MCEANVAEFPRRAWVQKPIAERLSGVHRLNLPNVQVSGMRIGDVYIVYS
jgi:hypothetical protein